MSRLSVFLAATISLLSCSLAFSQTSPSGTAPVRPGSATSTPLPGIPGPGGRPQSGTARIRGRVVAAQTGAPLRRAQVSLGSPTAQAAGPRSATTDSDGRFEFTDLPAGRYSVIVNKVGYVSLQYGQRRPTDSMTMLTLAEGERRDGVDFALPRGGVIAVRITDDFGDPLPGVQVQVQRYQYGPDSQRRLNGVFVAGVMGPNATDDRGEARLYGLAPGDYVVSAMARNQALGSDPNAANSDGFAVTFHPGTINANEAQTVTVSLAEETPIEFAMSSARLTRVSGTVVDSQGRPATGAFVSVVTRQGNGMSSSGGGSVSSDGTFTINGVAPGEYSLEVRTQPRPGTTDGMEFGSTSIVAAGAELTGVRIVTGRGATISGRVIFEGTAPRRNAGQELRVFPTPADPSRGFMLGNIANDPRSNGTVDENGNFQLGGMSGRVFLVVSSAGWVIRSISVDGQDVTDEPIDLTGKQSVAGLMIRLTDKLTQISGKVSDSRGQPSRECTVVFQTAEEREPIVAARLLRTVRCDSTGSFQVRGMRPGRYVVTALLSIDQGRQFEPEFREQLRRGSESLNIREGETLALDLKLTSGL
jgi:protocatechuate 3,4-dioxygenase beta subunit